MLLSSGCFCSLTKERMVVAIPQVCSRRNNSYPRSLWLWQNCYLPVPLQVFQLWRHYLCRMWRKRKWDVWSIKRFSRGKCAFGIHIANCVKEVGVCSIFSLIGIQICHLRNEKKPGESVISQWLVGPFLGTKWKMRGYVLCSIPRNDCEIRLAPDFLSYI